MVPTVVLSKLPSPHPVCPHQASTFCLLFFSHHFYYQNRSSPQIGCLRRGDNIYLGSLNFLDSLASFDDIFGITLVMLCVKRRAAGSCANEETEYLASRLNKYCDLCQFHLFCSIIKLQFVGTENYDTHRMIHDIHLALSELKLVYKSHGTLVTLTPDTL